MVNTTQIIQDGFKNHISVIEKTINDPHTIHIINNVSNMMYNAMINNNNKILIFGNGGSAADAQHVAAEFTNRFETERRPLPAIALTTDTSAITAIGNDYSFKQIFTKQVMALGNKGDVAIGISTSGTSPNVIDALQAAKTNNLKTVLFTGDKELPEHIIDTCDYIIRAQSNVTANIQECHILIWHILCRIIDQILDN